MRNAVDQFYGARACEAGNSIVCSNEYKDAQDRYIDLERALLATLSPEQRALGVEMNEANEEMNSLSRDAIFKAGFFGRLRGGIHGSG